MNTSSAHNIRLLREPQPAATLLHPLRLRLLHMLREPDSAAGLARRLELPRQRLNYHLRELEKEGLLELIEERKKGNCTERILKATARSYLISPEALGQLSVDPEPTQDRFSSAYLAASAARVLRDVGILRSRADEAGKRLGTLTLESEIRFASPGDRQAFTQELTQTLADLVARYHDEGAPGGRRFRLMVGAYPTPGEGNSAAETDTETDYENRGEE